MKKILLAATALLTIAGNSFAQTFTNPGFETWDTSNVVTSLFPPSSLLVESPKSWFGIDSLVASITPMAALAGVTIAPKKQVTKATDAHSGTYAVQLETKNLGDTLGNVPGVLVNAKVTFDLAAILANPDFSNFLDLVSYSNGTPTLGRKVDSVNVWAKLDSTNTDNASIVIMALQKQTINGVDSMVQIGGGTQLINPGVNTYTEFSVPVVYIDANNTATDTLIVVFSSTTVVSSSSQITEGNKLFVDDVSMATSAGSTGNVSIVQPLFSDTKVLVYPNPTQQTIYFNLNTREVAQDYSLSIYDINGRVISVEHLNNVINEKNVGTWVKGTYYYNLVNKKSKESTSGSFIVK